MKKMFLLLSVMTWVCSCSSPTRKPASSEPLVTRDGETIAMPELKIPLNVPLCGTPRTGLGECAEAGERELFDQVYEKTFRFQSAQNPISEKTSQRDFHARHHACLAGKWSPIVHNRKYSAGIFAIPAKSFPVVLRFSNGSPKSPAGGGQTPPDIQPDARGLAIKVVGVPGQSILKIEGTEDGTMNQDFVLINHPTFFLRTPKRYPEFMTRLTMGQPFFDLLDADELNSLKATNRVVADVTSETFFGQTPYQFGDNKNAKYRIKPCGNETVEPITETEKVNPFFLRQRVADRLAKKSLCFIFSVQLRTEKMDVEDAVVEWPNADSRFTDVAKIEVPQKQDINLPERDLFCENISFNPWNTLAENRPAGAINRARLAVYSGISRKRRMENKVPIQEPKPNDEFFSVLKMKR